VRGLRGEGFSWKRFRARGWKGLKSDWRLTMGADPMWWRLPSPASHDGLGCTLFKSRKVEKRQHGGRDRGSEGLSGKRLSGL